MKIERIREYINRWKERGYENDIPDECPDILSKLNLAPSYKAIALSILNNDHNFHKLGFTDKPSIYYDILKKIEIEGRDK